MVMVTPASGPGTSIVGWTGRTHEEGTSHGMGADILLINDVQDRVLHFRDNNRVGSVIRQVCGL